MARQRRTRDKQQGEEGSEEDRQGDAGSYQTTLLVGFDAHGLFIICEVVFFLFPFRVGRAASGFGKGDFLVIDVVMVYQFAGLFHHEEFRDCGNDERKHHGGRDDEEDIRQRADLILGIDELRGWSRNTSQQEVGDIENQRGIKSG